MSHRIIEKRRRDRMNNCLADLSRLIPAEYLKKGRGRVEKTEIIEMAIKHLQHLQQTAYNNQVPFPPTAPPSESSMPVETNRLGCSAGTTASATYPPSGEASVTTNSSANGSAIDSSMCTSGAPTNSISISGSSNNGWEGETSDVSLTPAEALIQSSSTGVRPIVTEHYRLGYQECVSEAMHFLVEVEGFFACDALCVRLISHLQRHCDRIVKGVFWSGNGNTAIMKNSANFVKMLVGSVTKTDSLHKKLAMGEKSSKKKPSIKQRIFTLSSKQGIHAKSGGLFFGPH